jgi:hypothetical protein
MLVLSLSMVACVNPTTDSTQEELGSTADELSTYIPPACDATCQSNGTLSAMNAVATKYGFPRWFVYAQVHRESSFNPNSKTGSGTGDCDIGYGLTQLTCAHHQGMSCPEGLASPSQSNPDWQGDMRISAFCSETKLCPWIDMGSVTKLTNRFDPMQNLDRYFSGYAAPAYFLEAARAPKQSGETDAAFHNRILRRVVWHWRYGHYSQYTYPNDPYGYLSSTSDHYRYDDYATQYRTAMEPIDGVWSGNVCKPPYSASGCSSGSSSSGTSYALTGTATQAISVTNFGLPTAGKTVKFHVYIPSGSNIAWVQPYVQQGASGNWAWTTSTMNMSQLTADSWNYVSVTVPSSATSVATIGLQFGKTSTSWTGSISVDSVTF